MCYLLTSDRDIWRATVSFIRTDIGAWLRHVSQSWPSASTQVVEVISSAAAAAAAAAATGLSSLRHIGGSSRRRRVAVVSRGIGFSRRRVGARDKIDPQAANLRRGGGGGGGATSGRRHSSMTKLSAQIATRLGRSRHDPEREDSVPWLFTEYRSVKSCS